MYEALGYPTDLKFDDYSSRYMRQDIAKAIINRPIQYTWKGPLILSENIEDEDTPFEKKWKELEKELHLKEQFIRLDKLSCIGQYGILLLGFDDVSDVAGFAKPVNKGKRNIVYVTPLSEGSAKIKSYNTNPRNNRFGQVEMYDLTIQSPGTQTTSTITVHNSRVLHITGELLEDNVHGVPVLKAVYNRLIDLEKLTGGSAEMFWRGARPGYQGKVDPDATLTSGVEEELQAQIDEYEHNLRRILVNEGVTFEALASQVSEPTAHVEVQLQMISSVTGIPKRILIGSERGELASSQDETGWLNLIQTRREEYAESKIIKPFIDIAMKYGILPTVSNYSIGWNDLFSPSLKDKADIGKTRAAALREYGTNPALETIVPPEAFFEFFLGLEGSQVEKIRSMSNAQYTEEMRERIANRDIDEIDETIETE